jgi:hypothetical protein
MKIIYQSNSQRLSVTVRDEARLLVSGATVTANLVDGSNQNVSGATNVSLLEGETGVYSAVIPNSFNPSAGKNYTLQLSAVKSGLSLYGETAIEVRKRTIS